MPKVTVEVAEDALIAALRQPTPERRRVLLNELAAGEPIVAKPISGEELAQTRYFRMLPDADPPALEPELPVSNTLANQLAGTDAVLATALSHRR